MKPKFIVTAFFVSLFLTSAKSESAIIGATASGGTAVALFIGAGALGFYSFSTLTADCDELPGGGIPFDSRCDIVPQMLALLAGVAAVVLDDNSTIYVKTPKDFETWATKNYYDSEIVNEISEAHSKISNPIYNGQGFSVKRSSSTAMFIKKLNADYKKFNVSLSDEAAIVYSDYINSI